MPFFKATVPAFVEVSVKADTQEQAEQMVKSRKYDLSEGKPLSLITSHLEDSDLHDFDIEQEEITNPDFVFERDRYNRFVLDMQAANIPFDSDEFRQDDEPYLRTYSGRGVWGKNCPAVYCRDSNDISKIEKATKLNLNRDSLGLGIILYP